MVGRCAVEEQHGSSEGGLYVSQWDVACEEGSVFSISRDNSFTHNSLTLTI